MSKLFVFFCALGFMLLAGCSRYRTAETHKDVELGMAKAKFEKLDDNGISDLTKINLKGASFNNYTMYAGEAKLHIFPVTVYYLFKDGSLEYYNEAQRFVVHDNELYREAAQQAWKQLEKE